MCQWSHSEIQINVKRWKSVLKMCILRDIKYTDTDTVED